MNADERAREIVAAWWGGCNANLKAYIGGTVKRELNALIATAIREAEAAAIERCAKVAEEMRKAPRYTEWAYATALADAAAAIRALATTPERPPAGPRAPEDA